MDLRDYFNDKQKARLIVQLNRKITKGENGHWSYPVMKSRKHRETVEITFERKFYPLWAVMEALGMVEEERPEGDCILVSNCGVRHCVNPEHMKWEDRGKYANNFKKFGIDHKQSKWTEEKLERLQEYLGEGLTQDVIASRLNVSQASVSNACRKLIK